MKWCLALIAVGIVTATEKIKVWKEGKGIAIIEGEHIQTRNDLPLYWSRTNAVDGYSGTGYLYWQGASFPGGDYSTLDETSALEYYVAIRKDGIYYIKIKGLCLNEYESQVLVRINESDWHKYSVRNEQKFSWNIEAKDSLCAAYLPMGYHKIEIAAASQGFMVDKFALIHESRFTAENPGPAELEIRESNSEYLSQRRFNGIN